MSGLGEWIVAYLGRLRPDLRATRDDRRLQRALRTAQDHGWHPHQLADRVNSGDYTGARNPVIVAIIECERLAETPPPRDPDTVATIGCADCVEGWVDTDGPTTPCPTCRPQLAARLAQVPPPGHRAPEHQHYLRHKRTMR